MKHFLYFPVVSAMYAFVTWIQESSSFVWWQWSWFWYCWLHDTYQLMPYGKHVLFEYRWQFLSNPVSQSQRQFTFLHTGIIHCNYPILPLSSLSAPCHYVLHILYAYVRPFLWSSMPFRYLSLEKTILIWVSQITKLKFRAVAFNPLQLVWSTKLVRLSCPLTQHFCFFRNSTSQSINQLYVSVIS